MQTIYHYDHSGIFTGASDADESPLEEGVWLVPANATTIEPPFLQAGQRARFSNAQWTIENIPAPIAEAPAVPTLDEVKALKVAEINAAAEGAIAPITSVYSLAERDTWPIQEAEAVAWTADNLTQTPILTAIATARGESVGNVVANVLAKAAAFKSLAGTTFGKRKALIDQVMAVQVISGDIGAAIAEVQAIAW